MKYLVALSAFVSGSVFAQEAQLPVFCLQRDRAIEVVQKYKEVPLIAFNSEEAKRTLLITANQQTGTWTAIIIGEGNTVCIVQDGTGFVDLTAKK